MYYYRGKRITRCDILRHRKCKLKVDIHRPLEVGDTESEIS